MISPKLRRALHEALDHAEPKRRGRSPAPLPDPKTIDPAAMAKADAALKRAGLK